MSEAYLLYKNKRHHLGEGICVLGRDPTSCHICFDDRELSRQHALLIKQETQYVLLDYKSSNGVTVNDKPVQQVTLKNGDWIRMGQQLLQFVVEGAAPGLASMSQSGNRPRPGALTTILDLRKAPLETTPAPPAPGTASSGESAPVLATPSIPQDAPTQGAGAGNLEARLASLIKASQIINSELDLDKLLNKVIDVALEVMRADRGFVMVLDDKTGKLLPRVHRQMEGMIAKEGPIHISRTITELAMAKKEAILTKDAWADKRFAMSGSIQMYNIRSAMAVPLVTRDKVLGLIYLDNRIQSHCFEDDDLEMMQAFAVQAAIAVDNARLVDSIKEEEHKRTNLSRYLSPAVVNKIIQHEGAMTLGGEKVLATILFADIRGFTSFSEDKNPQQVVEFLNEFLTLMTKAIFDQGGTLDKYLGDGLMANFGAPMPLADHPLRAIAAALEMQRVMTLAAPSWQQRFAFNGLLGIGINTAEVISGNIGSADRMDLTVIGDGVNLAARLQAQALHGEVVISERTFNAVKDRVRTEEMGLVKVKGKKEEVRIFKVVSIKPAESEGDIPASGGA